MEVKKKKITIWSSEYWIKRGMTLDEARIKVSEIQRKNSLKSKETVSAERKSQWNKYFWKNRGYSEEDAILKVQKLQAENSAKSSKFKGHRHTAVSKKKISIGSKKTADAVGPTNMVARFGVQTNNGKSNIELECYTELQYHFPELSSSESIYGFVVDMLLDKLIIEFHGDYWHTNPKIFNEDYYHSIVKLTAKEIWEKDECRRNILKRYGYDMFIIWESDWRYNKDNVINNICLKVESLRKR